MGTWCPADWFADPCVGRIASQDMRAPLHGSPYLLLTPLMALLDYYCTHALRGLDVAQNHIAVTCRI